MEEEIIFWLCISIFAFAFVCSYILTKPDRYKLADYKNTPPPPKKPKERYFVVFYVCFHGNSQMDIGKASIKGQSHFNAKETENTLKKLRNTNNLTITSFIEFKNEQDYNDFSK